MIENQNLYKPRLVILSDLWGKEKSDWMPYYSDILEADFDITYYDTCDLGNIDKSDYTEQAIHNQFITGGIEYAVHSLLQKEKRPIYVLGFSVGGFIAWKACFEGLDVVQLFAISSTRLRYETLKPHTQINLIFGENDDYKPSDNWFKELGLSNKIYKNESHQLYKKRKLADEICKMIAEKLIPSK